MVEVDKVGKLVRGDVVDERERRLHQAPVEANVAAPGAAPPLGLRVGQREAAGRASQPAGDACKPPGQQALCTREQPAPHQFPGIRIQRRINTQGIAVPAYLVE